MEEQDQAASRSAPFGAGSPAFAELCEHIVETARHLFIVLDERLDVAFTNPVLFDQLGYRPEEVLGRPALDFVHPDDVAIAGEALEQIVTEADGQLGVGAAMGLRLQAADGGYRWFEVGAQSLLDEPRVRGTILHCRAADSSAWLDQALRSVAEGRPLDDVLTTIARAAAAAVEPARAVVAWDWEGDRFAHAVPPGLPGALRGQAASGEATPWAQAMAQGGPVDAELSELPAAVASAARTVGVGACWVVPVRREGRDHDAVLLVWRDVAGPSTVSYRVALDRVATAIELAFQRHGSDLALHFAARHDMLTGIANRARFFERLDELATADGGAGAGPLHGVLYLDLDDFKPVNDLYGHAAGDEVLRVVSRRLRSHLRSDDLVARIGGDEFAVLCPEVPTADQLGAVAERLVAAIAEPIALGEGAEAVTVRVAASIGVAAVDVEVLPRMGGDALLEQADRALRAAKAAGKHRWHLATVG